MIGYFVIDVCSFYAYAVPVVALHRNIDDVDKTMDEINEQTENMKQIQEALSTPIGTAADIDEVSLDLQYFVLNVLNETRIIAG